MNGFTLALHDATQVDRIDNVTSFVGEDASGSFGIRAGHARMIASLVFGLARYRVDEGDWRYLALPGGLLYFHDNVLTLSTRHYVIGDDYEKMSAVLEERLRAEEETLGSLKRSVHRMEEEALRRLWRLGKPEVEL
jgi:F-type H+-transporting ATPase subunit epsilon